MKASLPLIAIFLMIVSPIVAEQHPSFYKDSLEYSTVEQALGIWKAFLGKDAEGLLGVESEGIRLKDVSGDSYEDQNDQKAVFLRKPRLSPPYYILVTVKDFNPPERFGQAGIVAWKDADNYVRATIGFESPGLECLGEFNGKPQSRGVLSIYPVKKPVDTQIRMEVLPRSVRASFSHDGKLWLGAGGATLPGKNRCEDFWEGVGILGVAGSDSGTPLFCDWKEGALPRYKDDEFNGNMLCPPWKLGLANGGWGSENTRIYVKKGKLFIHPFPGSDIFLGNENYAYVFMPAPEGDSWEIEVKLEDFNPMAKGSWNKAGVVLWQDSRHFLDASLVADKQGDQVYFEIISSGEKSFFPGVVTKGFSPRKKTDAFFRIKRSGLEKYQVKGSLDGKKWIEMGVFTNPLFDPEIRLFASGDIYIQHPESYDFHVGFDYIRKIDD